MARKILMFVGIVVGLAWFGIVGWSELVEQDPLTAYRDAMIQNKINDCSGDLAQRYDCKSAIMLKVQRDKFIFWMGKLLYVFGPLVVLRLLYSFAYNRLEPPKPPRKAGRLRDDFPPTKADEEEWPK
jgi:hypothetical protein